MLGIMAGMTRRACFSLRPLVSGSHLFAVLSGLTVDTCYVSLQRLLWVDLFVFSAMLGSTVALGDDFFDHGRIYCNAWFDTGYMQFGTLVVKVFLPMTLMVLRSTALCR